MPGHTTARAISQTWRFGVATFLTFACVAITLRATAGQDARGTTDDGNQGAEVGLPVSRDHAWHGVIRWRTGAAVSTCRSAAEIATAIEDGLAHGRRHFIAQFDRRVGSASRSRSDAAGLRLLSCLGSNAFFASVTPGRLDVDTLSESDGLIDVRAIDRVWKLHPVFARNEVPAWTVVGHDAAGTPIIAVYVVLHSDMNLDDEAASLGPAYGAVIRSKLCTVNALVAELPYTGIEALADEDAVQWIEPALPPLTATNDSNRQITQADEVQELPYELNGSGVAVLVYDVGAVDLTHPDFADRLTIGDESSVDDHPTHVAGTAGGSGAASDGLYRGMAPGISLVSYAIGGDLVGVPLYTDPYDIEHDYGEAIQVFGVDLATNSIGTNTCSNGFDCEITGDYGVTASVIDAIVVGELGEPLIVVWANGNERSCSRCREEGVHTPEGYHSTAPPSCAKNHITVGALNSNDDSVTYFTSWGPTDDGRIKPDVAAPGCQTDDDEGVTSCVPGGDYDSYCGTSMAAPTVAGLTALLLEDLWNRIPDLPRPLSSTVKVLLAHNAVDLGNPGPDYESGYGSVRIRDTIDFARTGTFFEDQVDQGETCTFVTRVDPNDAQLKITLAWDDAPATPNVDPTLVNDLDLVVYDPSSTQCLPWTLDPNDPEAPAVQTQADHVNNIEQVLVDAPAPGIWTVYVSAFNVPDGPQQFSICGSPHLAPDCDGNGLPDDEEILADPSLDCTGNGILDICEPDCNGNGVADSCDIADGTSEDCDNNGVPDECQPDCNGNGVADACDIADSTSEDCDADGVPDECQDTSADCNGNGVWDACDIADGTSADENLNGIPDECEASHTIYVDDDGPFDPAPGDPLISDPDEDGSLEHPYDAIGEAIAAALDGDSVEIADGLYAGWANVNLDFSGKAVDLHSANGPENCVMDCESVYRGIYFHSGETAATRVEGLTIRGGYDFFWGGAIFCQDSSPTLANCKFENAWSLLGSAVYIRDASPTITNCVFADNFANYGGAGFVTLESNPTFAACTFRNNTAALHGGALDLRGDGVTRVIDCAFLDNEATGGDNSPRCAGAVYVAAEPELTGCLFNGNACLGEYARGGAIRCSSGNATLTNCIVWGNTPDEISGEAATVQFCNVQGGYEGEGNIGTSPLFADPNAGDFHLSEGSPCINAGDSHASGLRDVDIEGNPRVQQCHVDIGPYESPYPPESFEDCNNNGQDDDCDIYFGLSADCNDNDVLDECDLADGTSVDCQPNGIPDECDIADGLSDDCNGNDVPDECDIADATSADCNGNDVPDECDLADETSADCNDNGILDECDIADGTSDDYDLNGLPDECEDCNENGIPDACDMDCEVGNCAGHPLGCGTSMDCNANSIPDDCELAAGTSHDCNGNNVLDECDIADGTSEDTDGNGVPDECQQFIYVDDDADNDPAPGDPTISDPLEDGTPEHPYDAIQEAVDAAYQDDDITVLDGVYTGIGNKYISMINGIYLHSENGPEYCVIEQEGIETGFRFVNHDDPQATLEGFTIRNGERGIQCSGSHPTIHNCIITGHVAQDYDGGGVRCYNSAPRISHCIVDSNTTLDGTGGGINIYNGDTVPPMTISNCVIMNNSASEEGGGIYVSTESPVAIRNCLITDNVAVYKGGGIYDSTPSRAHNVTVAHCSIVNNAAIPEESYDYSYGGGVSTWGSNAPSEMISNCIVWGNTATTAYPQIAFSYDGDENVITYCNIQDDQDLEAGYYEIITTDPLFVDPADDDYHLLSESPCINRGDPNCVADEGDADIDDQPRVYDGRVDIGVDEFYSFTDCNHNGISDNEDIANQTSSDCNGNQVPDECDGPDCNGNDVLDECDIDSGESLDCNVNGIPDECERDCNGNGLPDECDIADGTSFDENDNGVPDECEYVSRVFYVDDDAPGDPAAGDPEVSDPNEDGSLDHPYDAIQEAIDAGSSEDEIIVRDGLYTGAGNRNVSFCGKRICLHSENGPETCVIDCEYEDLAFVFTEYESRETRLEGITIRAGISSSYASAITCEDSSPTIYNCVISETESVFGGPVHLSNSDALIDRCRLASNDGLHSGYGGITWSDGSQPTIRDCVFVDNHGCWSGAVSCYHESTVIILNCTIVGNSALRNSGAISCSASSPIIRNCIIWDNESPTNLPVHLGFIREFRETRL